jgi:hypothetical protein
MRVSTAGCVVAGVEVDPEGVAVGVVSFCFFAGGHGQASNARNQYEYGCAFSSSCFSWVTSLFLVIIVTVGPLYPAETKSPPSGRLAVSITPDRAQQ